MEVIAQRIKEGFESSSRKTPEFNRFARLFKQAIKQELMETARDIVFSVGHFYISGFFTVGRTGQIYYFSISDVRDYINPQLLVRTAEDYKDYTGGHNQYVQLESGKLKELVG